MAKKIYISPSDQVHNTYAYGNTNEAEQCRRIAAACKAALERCGFLVKTNFNDGKNAMYEREAESNAWGADMHICVHSNAGGGKGAEVYISTKDDRHMKPAQAIYNEVKAISPYGSTRGIKVGKWHEIVNTNALCVYLETDFHDNKTIAKWIVENTESIGEAICKGVCETYGVKYTTADSVKAKKTCTVNLPVLRKGDTGVEVLALQTLLIAHNRKCGFTVPDGIWGSKTDAAVRAYQNEVFGKADGIVGKQTWARLLGGEYREWDI